MFSKTVEGTNDNPPPPQVKALEAKAKLPKDGGTAIFGIDLQSGLGVCNICKATTQNKM